MVAIPTSLGPGHLDIEGCLNFRDAGGWAADGGRVRRARLYRADDPIRLTDRGRASVEALGLSAVIDLRQHAQYIRSEGFVRDRLQVHHRPLVDRVIDLDNPPRLEQPSDLTDLYDEMLDRSQTQMGEVLDLVADHIASGPVLVHCAYGKDRTGLAVALIHAALGVGADDIVADWARSDGPAMARRQWIIDTLRPDDPPVRHAPPYLFTAPAPAMAELLARMARRHGSLTGWVHSLPLTPGTLATLRAHLIEPT